MKILVYESQAAQHDGESSMLSASGFRGDILLHALLSDVSQLNGAQIIIVRDPMLPVPSLPSSVQIVACRPDQAALSMNDFMRNADAVWPIVPESGGMLEAASRQILDQQKILLGSLPAAVSLTGSKYRTSEALKRNGVVSVATYRLGDTLPDHVTAWVVKPDDGAGCTNTHLFPDQRAACSWIEEHGPERFVLQPYVHGRHCSMSIVCAGNGVLMMSLNEQRMVVSDNQLHYMGSIVNGLDYPFGKFKDLAETVLAAVPGLWGYVGIDFIMSAEGPVILEVNPRMTTSHVGLHESVGFNPAQLMLDVVRSGRSSCIEPRRIRPVSVDINAFPDRQHRRQELGHQFV